MAMRYFLFSKLLSVVLVAQAWAVDCVVVRHGEAEHNVQKVFSASVEGSKNYPLTLKGKAQVRTTAQKMRTDLHLTNLSIDQVYASPLLRTQQTARILIEDMGIDPTKLVTDSNLAEGSMGKYEGKSVKEYPYGDDWDHSHGHEYGGETDVDISKRLKTFLNLRKAEHHRKTILIVTHGTPANELEKLLEQKPNPTRMGTAEFRVFHCD